MRRKPSGVADDPRTVKASVEAAHEQAAADTVEVVAAQFIQRHASKRRWRELSRVMERDVVPQWRDRPMTSITRREVIDLIDDIAARAPTQANRTLTILSIFFGWALDRDIIENDPTNRVRKPTKETPRERVLTAPEIAAFWHGCEAIGEPFGQLFKLLLLTAQRKSEIAHLEWTEIESDKQRVEIAGAKYKTGKPHGYPLPAAAFAILSTRRKIDGCKYVHDQRRNTRKRVFESQGAVRCCHASAAAADRPDCDPTGLAPPRPQTDSTVGVVGTRHPPGHRRAHPWPRHRRRCRHL
jgi:integrase